jgi:hypothetical protein
MDGVACAAVELGEAAAVAVNPATKVATASVLTKPLSAVGCAGGIPVVLALRPIMSNTASSSTPSRLSLTQPFCR